MAREQNTIPRDRNVNFTCAPSRYLRYKKNETPQQNEGAEVIPGKFHWGADE